MSYKKIIALWLFVSLQTASMPSSAETQTVYIQAGADNTLYEDPAGSVSNGEGAILLSGRTNNEVGSIRRAVLYFDVAGELPYGAVVEAASLHLYLERGNGGVRELRLHRLNTDWGEGGSQVNGGGLGAQAEPGDATWLHTFYPDAFWGRDGGQYIGRVSAVQAVGDPGAAIDTPGPYTWDSTSRLVDDVRRWLRKPDQNFGWILIGDESVSQTVKRFSSRENVTPGLQPMLEVTYSIPE